MRMVWEKALRLTVQRRLIKRASFMREYFHRADGKRSDSFSVKISGREKGSFFEGRRCRESNLPQLDNEGED